MVERVLACAANEQIFVAIVVVIADGHSEIEVEAIAREARLGGNIFESPVGALLQQTVVIGRVHFLQFGQLGTVGEEEIHAAVVIEIE